MISYPFSHQTVSIYRLLTHKQPLTASDIGKELHIFPNAVYRAIKPLIDIGITTKSKDYPTRYSTQPSNSALEKYLLIMREAFLTTFISSKLLVNDSPFLKSNLNISLIQDRNDLIEKTNKSVESSKQTVDYVVSGLEVPAETILVYKRAIDRGVKIRSIVQRLDNTSKEMFSNWKKIGLNVRFYPSLESRIFIFDKKIVYLTSYDSKNKEEAVGVSFEYPPFGEIITELFNKKWQLAKKIV